MDVAAARAALEEALRDFREHSRERERRFDSFVRELEKQHEFDLRRISRMEKRFAKAVDPDGVFAEDSVLVNWNPGDYEGVWAEDAMPDGDIDDALDDIKELEKDAKEHYENASDDDDEL